MCCGEYRPCSVLVAAACLFSIHVCHSCNRVGAPLTVEQFEGRQQARACESR